MKERTIQKQIIDQLNKLVEEQKISNLNVDDDVTSIDFENKLGWWSFEPADYTTKCDSCRNEAIIFLCVFNKYPQQVEYCYECLLNAFKDYDNCGFEEE